jgi:Flp pilus assembly protein TadD
VFRRGFALSRLGRTAEARQEIEKALALKEGPTGMERANACALLGRRAEAAVLFEAALASPGADLRDGCDHALLRLEQGDEGGYRRACRSLVDRLRRGGDWRSANVVAWACTHGPEALPDLGPAAAAARVAVRLAPTDPNVRNTLGATLHRAGRSGQAVIELTDALERSREGGPADFLFLALAQHRLGRAAEARKRLAQARQSLEDAPPSGWQDLAAFGLLLREAERQIGPPAGTK